VPPLLEGIEPVVKVLMELLVQGVPLFSCTDLFERDTLSSSHGRLLVWQDEVTLSCCLWRSSLWDVRITECSPSRSRMPVADGVFTLLDAAVHVDCRHCARRPTTIAPGTRAGSLRRPLRDY
jgi:hypothetical protein